MNRKTFLVGFLVIGLVFSFAGVALAEEWFVSASVGNNYNSGKFPNAPLKSIGDAITKAAATQTSSDTIYVEKGTYDTSVESFPIEIDRSADLTIQFVDFWDANPGPAEIDAGGATTNIFEIKSGNSGNIKFTRAPTFSDVTGVFIGNADGAGVSVKSNSGYYEFEGLYFADLITGIQFTGNPDNVGIRRNYFYQSRFGIHFQGAVDDTHSDPKDIYNNLFEELGRGIYFQGDISTNAVDVVHNRFEDCTDYVTMSTLNTGAGIFFKGLSTPNATGLYVNFNEFINNSYGVYSNQDLGSDPPNFNYNWWGDPTGPDYPTKNSGNGDQIGSSGNLDNIIDWPAGKKNWLGHPLNTIHNTDSGQDYTVFNDVSTGGDYAEPGALDNPSPGDTITVEDGIYKISAVSAVAKMDIPVTLQAASRPVIDATTWSGMPSQVVHITPNEDGEDNPAVFKGFDVRGGDVGVLVDSANVPSPPDQLKAFTLEDLDVRDAMNYGVKILSASTNSIAGEGLNVKSCNITENGTGDSTDAGIFLNAANGLIGRVLLEDNTVNSNDGHGIRLVGTPISNTPTPSTSHTVAARVLGSSSEVNDNEQYGVYLQNSVDLSGTSVRDSTILGNGSAGIAVKGYNNTNDRLEIGDPSAAGISNVIKSNGFGLGGAGAGILIGGSFGTGGTSSTTNPKITIARNDILNNKVGVLAKEAGPLLDNSSDTSASPGINYNNISGNQDYGVLNTDNDGPDASGNVDATYNWWDTVPDAEDYSGLNGPGDKASTYVKVDNYLDAEVTTEVYLSLTFSGAGSGTVNVDGTDYTSGATISFAPGTSVDLEATADSGSNFSKWVIAGSDNTSNPVTVTMDSDKSVEVVFESTAGQTSFSVNPGNSTPSGEGAWSLVSMPVEPDNTDPSAVFDEVSGTLYLWEYADGSWNTVEDGNLTSVDSLGGYYFWLPDGTSLDEISLTGSALEGNQSIDLDSAGWQLFGVPYEVNWSDDGTIGISDGTNNYNLVDAVNAGWINNTIWELNGDGETFSETTVSEGKTLDPGKGYWIYTQVNGLTMTFSESGGPSGGPPTPSAAAINLANVEKVESDPPMPITLGDLSVDSLQVKALSQTGRVTFRVSGEGAPFVNGVKVEVLDSNGRRLKTLESGGNTVNWSTADVPNGLYLYMAFVDVEGGFSQTNVGKVLVLD